MLRRATCSFLMTSVPHNHAPCVFAISLGLMSLSSSRLRRLATQPGATAKSRAHMNWCASVWMVFLPAMLIAFQSNAHVQSKGLIPLWVRGPSLYSLALKKFSYDHTHLKLPPSFAIFKNFACRSKECQMDESWSCPACGEPEISSWLSLRARLGVPSASVDSSFCDSSSPIKYCSTIGYGST
jgi:hypothetical protein